MLADTEFEAARRLLAWEWAVANTGADANGVYHSPTPPATDAVPLMMGAQGHIEMHMRWSTAVRPGTGLVRVILLPHLTTYYGFSTPANNNTADATSFVPVRAANGNTRLSQAALGAAFSVATPVSPTVYRPRLLAPPAAVSERTTGLELQLYRLEVFRAAPPVGPASYLQAQSFELRLWGQEPQGYAPTAERVPVQRPLSFVVDWEGAGANDPANPPFVTGDAITLLFRTGAANGGR